jgi:alcohol dehydrogenase (NADP+)
MLTKTLNNGNIIPVVGLGTWLSQPGEVYSIVKTAIEEGYRHIDCAAIYGNEEEIGKALSEVLSEGIVKREELFITSKLWNNAHANENVMPALQKSLNNLQLDYLDLYLIHWPVAFKEEVMFPESIDEYIALEKMPIIDTWRAMETGVEKGLIKSIGVSNFSIKKIEKLVSLATIKPVINQVELHPYLQQNALLASCKKHNVLLTGYSPLGSSGRPAEMTAESEPSLLDNKVILQIAKKNNKSPAQIILNWALTRGTIIIPKTVTPARAIQNFSAQNFELSETDMNSINELDVNFRYVNGGFFTPEGSPYTLANLWDE